MRTSSLLVFALSLGLGCGGDGGTGGASDAAGPGDAGGADAAPPRAARVHVVLFTHIEDNTPPGMIGSPMSRDVYDRTRGKLIEMAELARAYELPWTLQPDWKLLEAARVYEDAATTATTGGKNFLLYLGEDLGVTIDPHSHENGGYNYTDVAYLLELLGVGGSTVIGGHIWDPALAEFQEWDRFRTAQPGLRYPAASWRGDILMGAGTPNHTNDPIVSGVWRPRDRDNFFVDDPAGNIVSIGAWRDEAAGLDELVDAYASGAVSPDAMLTFSWGIRPVTITAGGGLAEIETTVLAPVAALRAQGSITVTTFTELVEIWNRDYGGEAFLYQP